MKNLWMRITNPEKYKNEQMYARWNAYIDSGLTDEEATHRVCVEFKKPGLSQVMGSTFRYRRSMEENDRVLREELEKLR